MPTLETVLPGGIGFPNNGWLARNKLIASSDLNSTKLGFVKRKKAAAIKTIAAKKFFLFLI